MKMFFQQAHKPIISKFYTFRVYSQSGCSRFTKLQLSAKQNMLPSKAYSLCSWVKKNTFQYTVFHCSVEVVGKCSSIKYMAVDFP